MAVFRLVKGMADFFKSYFYYFFEKLYTVRHTTHRWRFGRFFQVLFFYYSFLKFIEYYITKIPYYLLSIWLIYSSYIIFYKFFKKIIENKT